MSKFDRNRFKDSWEKLCTKKQTDKQTDRHYENNGHLAVKQLRLCDAVYGVQCLTDDADRQRRRRVALRLRDGGTQRASDGRVLTRLITGTCPLQRPLYNIHVKNVRFFVFYSCHVFTFFNVFYFPYVFKNKKRWKFAFCALCKLMVRFLCYI